MLGRSSTYTSPSQSSFSISKTMSSAHSLRSVSSYTTFSSCSTLVDKPSYSSSSNASPVLRCAATLPNAVYSTGRYSLSDSTLSASTTTATFGISSLLGPAHHATPAHHSVAVRFLAKLFPGSILDRKMRAAHEKGEREIVRQNENSVKDQKIQGKKGMRSFESEEQRLKYEQKVRDVIEKDRQMGEMFSQLGL